MAKKQRDPRIGDASMEGRLQQEPISEEEADELAERGEGFQVRREAARTAAREPHEAHARHSMPVRPEPEDRATRRVPPLSPAEEGPPYPPPDEFSPADGATFQRGTGDESLTEQERAEGHFESEPEPTQVEEDFGERGLHTAGGIHDSAHEPSILDPDED